ncbi:MAG: GTP 3',8-cyclase MoaA [Crocinitomix sp.]|nr:GTP 3',8-cyclase MoaA [Crocinitomix sp.]
MEELKDTFGRTHDYLRISLLERCNLRCTYCMPEEGVQLRDKSEFMTQEELLHITKLFVSMGIKKIRLTGGEPLIKKNFSSIIQELSALPVELTLTTNAVLLDRFITDLKAANVQKLNISLDSLNEARFNAISRRKDFKKIMANINLAVKEGFDVKLNVVLMKGVNDAEIIDFIQLSKNQKINIRFIEFMPFNGNEWDWSTTVSYQSIMAQVNQHFGEENLVTETAKPNSTSKNFRIKGYQGDFGIISTITNPFCDTCNRIRLTADGRIKNCLFSATETDLLSALRKGEEIAPLIRQNILKKQEKRAGIDSFESEAGKEIFSQNRSMTTIGG